VQTAADLFGLLLTVWVGVLCLAAGSFLGRRSRASGQRGAALLSVAVVAFGASHYQPLRSVVGETLAIVGGEGVAACWALLGLLGVASGMAGKQARRWLLFLAATISFGELFILSGAPLYWRLFGDPLRHNVVDSSGILQQSTGLTCGPAAGAMLASKSGIQVSEGDLAERAGTNPLVGTSEFALARALSAVSGNHAHAYARRCDLTTARRIGRPFVAYIMREGVGGHAILVEKIADTVETIDPLTGSRDRMAVADFKREWTGVGVWLSMPPKSRDD
jgi:hypothetical protein